MAAMPDFADLIIVIDDKSADQIAEIVEVLLTHRSDLILIRHAVNQGVGGAIASGYKWARDNDLDVAVVMAGDGQMDPEELSVLLDPVVEGRVDYAKGNRLLHHEAFNTVPKSRYFGDDILSLLTKIASEYWHIADAQSGYTAIGKSALRIIDWGRMYKR